MRGGIFIPNDITELSSQCRLEPSPLLIVCNGVNHYDSPPFLQKKKQMAANDVFLTKRIARLRIHVERTIGRVKEYKILKDTLPASMWDSLSNVIYVCCMLSNFEPPLVC